MHVHVLPSHIIVVELQGVIYSLVARSLMVSMNWVAHDLFFMKPCWKSESIWYYSKNFMVWLCSMCSMALQQIDVNGTAL